MSSQTARGSKFKRYKKISYRVVVSTPLEKYESQLGSLFPIDGKIKFMFQTTNQHRIALIAS